MTVFVHPISLCTPDLAHIGLFFQVEAELRKICGDVLLILNKNLIPNASSGESKSFFYKMLKNFMSRS